MKLWAGQTISEIGSRITRDGLPLAAVMTLGASPAEMGLLSAVGSAAVLVFGLFAGVWVDRVRRRPILIIGDVARALLLSSIPLAAVWGVLRMEQLYIVAALAGIFTVFFDVAYQSYVPVLVERECVVEANSKLGMSSGGAEVVGPGLTGVLVQTLTAPIAILFDAISFLVSAVFVALIRTPEPPPVPAANPHVAREIAEGLRAVFHQPLLAALARRAATVNFFYAFLGPLYALYAIRELDVGPVWLGLSIAAGGVGNSLGAMLAQRTARRFGLGRTLIGTCLVVAFALALLPLARGPRATAVAFLMVSQLLGDIAFSMYNVHEISLRQVITPDRLLGRVNASMQLMTRGVWPVGSIVGGALAAGIGMRATLAIAAAGVLLSVLWLVFSEIPRLRELPEPSSNA